MADPTASDAAHGRPRKSANGAPAPEPAVRRLSLYLRQFQALQVSGVTTVSSKQLAGPLGLTDAQVRKDLGYFGQFGRPGKGYNVEGMIRTIRRILGTDRVWNLVLIGAGNLGSALAGYRGFIRKGFRIVAVFDKDPEKVGHPLANNPALVVQRLDELPAVVREQEARLAILAAPAEAAQEVAEYLVHAGVQGILNFAPVALSLPKEARVNDVDLAVELEQLAFHVSSTPSPKPDGQPAG